MAETIDEAIHEAITFYSAQFAPYLSHMNIALACLWSGIMFEASSEPIRLKAINGYGVGAASEVWASGLQ